MLNIFFTTYCTNFCQIKICSVLFCLSSRHLCAWTITILLTLSTIGCCCIIKYSKTWVSDHLAWATTLLPWATVFSCTDAILIHFTLSPATTWQTRPVAYLELVIYLLNATIILLQNTKLTVKFTRDGRPYPHLTPHCHWPGRLLFMVGPWLTGTTGSQTPCGLLTIAHLIALASLNVFSRVSKRKICSFQSLSNVTNGRCQSNFSPTPDECRETLLR